MSADERAEWLEWRRQGIGASDIAAAFTRSYEATPRSVVASKLGLAPPKEPTERMERGHDWEPKIAKAVEALLGFTVGGEQTWCSNPGQPWMRATVDGFLLRSEADTVADAVGLLEIKTTEHPNWAYYSVQAQWQMLVTGLPLVVLAILDLTDDSRLSSIDDETEVLVDRNGKLTLDVHHADVEVQARLIEFAAELWAHVEAGTLPDIEANDLKAVKASNPHVVDDAPVDLTDIQDLLGEWHRIKAAQKVAESRRDEIEARIIDRIGDHGAGSVGGVTWLTRSEQADNRIDTKRLKAEAPEVAEQFTKRGTKRVLRETKEMREAC